MNGQPNMSFNSLMVNSYQYQQQLALWQQQQYYAQMAAYSSFSSPNLDFVAYPQNRREKRTRNTVALKEVDENEPKVIDVIQRKDVCNPFDVEPEKLPRSHPMYSEPLKTEEEEEVANMDKNAVLTNELFIPQSDVAKDQEMMKLHQQEEEFSEKTSVKSPGIFDIISEKTKKNASGSKENTEIGPNPNKIEKCKSHFAFENLPLEQAKLQETTSKEKNEPKPCIEEQILKQKPVKVEDMEPEKEINTPETEPSCEVFKAKIPKKNTGKRKRIMSSKTEKGKNRMKTAKNAVKETEKTAEEDPIIAEGLVNCEVPHGEVTVLAGNIGEETTSRTLQSPVDFRKFSDELHRPNSSEQLKESPEAEQWRKVRSRALELVLEHKHGAKLFELINALAAFPQLPLENTVEAVNFILAQHPRLPHAYFAYVAVELLQEASIPPKLKFLNWKGMIKKCLQSRLGESVEIEFVERYLRKECEEFLDVNPKALGAFIRREIPQSGHKWLLGSGKRLRYFKKKN